MKLHWLWLQGFELDFGKTALGDFAPAVDAGLGLRGLPAIQAAQKLTGIFPRSHRTHRGTSKGFDRVAAQKFVPVVIEQVAGGKDVAPSDFAAVPDNHADNALTLETGSRAAEAALDFGNEIIDGDAHRARLINLLVGLRSEEHTSELQSRGQLVCR